jgi:class 3 adenylate cyclase
MQESNLSYATFNIQNYVSFCEINSDVDIIEYLNTYYFSVIHKSITEFHGTIDKIVADRQFAYWSSIEPCKNANEAFMAIIKANTIIKENNKIQKNELNIHCSFGLSTGKAIIRPNMVLGTCINRSNRTASMYSSFPYSFFIDNLTYELLKKNEQNQFELLPSIQVKGNNQIQIYGWK